MADETPRITAACPDCGARLTIDQKTGAVLWHESKPAPKENRSIKEMMADLAQKQKDAQERVEREKEVLKDQSRILDERVKEALKRVDKNAPPPTRPIDLD
ncbi:MAG: 2-nitropropane dioxygenase [Nitrospirae bacterium]|nr:2-nitropropane dioxygenase [Nitrospirota bacterium]